ncbi:MAG: sulfate adenylyltransferase subunit 1 [Campylobacterota bacterium]|nr:sulfate adenylyltransferase subunit 1 [Campylobacterota bacterium]
MSALNNIKTIKKDILRFIACGSVDDGKSTFIGRLLYDTGSVFDDQLATLEKESKSIGNAGKEIDFSLLVDGLSSEREQGITIDVAYRYFETESRKFIIADTPGHEQYTRNMATAASNADLAVILIDAKNGVLPQSKRHSFIASLCGIKYAIVAVNKMDVVEYKEEVFENIKKEFLEATKTLGFEKLFFVPISALKGENIVTKSEKTPWYKKESLLELLESVKIKKEEFVGFRLPVQLVNRPDRTFRGFCGTIASGEIAVNESIKLYQSK